MDAPNREDYQNAADHEKAWKAWVHRTRKIDHGMRKIVKKYKPTSQPQREHFDSEKEYGKAWRKWARTSRKVNHAMQKHVKGQVAKGDKEQAKIWAKANGEKKPGLFSKLFGKGKRELAYEWDELE